MQVLGICKWLHKLLVEEKKQQILQFGGKGSIQVTAQAVFKEIAFGWQKSGFAACWGMRKDEIPAEKYYVVTLNGNFEGRQEKTLGTF